MHRASLSRTVTPHVTQSHGPFTREEVNIVLNDCFDVLVSAGQH